MDKERITALKNRFDKASPILVALGDETRIHILLEMLSVASTHEHCQGMRVGEIARVASLSRPAISHHLKIMKDAGLIQCHHEGTKNFYYLDPDDTKLGEVIALLKEALALSHEEEKEHGHTGHDAE